MNVYETPKKQEFHLEGVKHISVKSAFELISDDKIFFIDVREKAEHRIEYFDFNNVFLYPLSTILDNIQLIPNGVPLVIVCNEGIRSAKVANLLNRQGFSNVSNLDGGIHEWRNQGLPITEGIKIADISGNCNSGGCSCGCDGCG